jgi:fructose-bisphosphate aldolase class II
MLEAIIRTAEEIFPDAIFAVHLDHGDEQTCYDCIDSGFYSSVMIDASHESFEDNIAITRRVVDRAHEKGISVEASSACSAASRKTSRSMKATPA